VGGEIDMNKYLSYERSKRLAELGYKPDGKLYSVEGWYVYERDGLESPPIFINDQYAYDRFKEGFTLPYNRDWYCKQFYSKIDCHDLLMELQSHLDHWTELEIMPSNDPLKRERFGISTYKRVKNTVEFVESDWLYDPNPVEALGAALIKLLEEKQ
jgi:hypothetical protein